MIPSACIAIRGVTDIKEIIPKPLVSMLISLPFASATDFAMLKVRGVRKAEVSAPPVTPPESKARPTNS